MLKNIIVLAAGSGGDITPLIAVATEFGKRGLNTTMLGPIPYAHLAANLPITYLSIGAEDVFEQVFNSEEIWDSKKGAAAAWRYYGAVLESSLSILEKMQLDPSNTALVCSSFAVAGRVAEEALGFKYCCTVHLSPAVIFSHCAPPRWPAASIPKTWPVGLQTWLARRAERLFIDPLIAKAVQPVRARWSLAAQPFWFSRWLHAKKRVAYAFPTWFAPAASDWPAVGQHAGFIWQNSQPMPADPQLSNFIDDQTQPLAVVTAGTAVATPPAWLAVCIQYLLQHGYKILLIARPHPSLSVMLSSTSVLQRSHVPFDQVLPKAQLLVHHAGIGSAVAAIRAGIAQWVFPTAHDQPDNADRLVSLGLARSFSPRPNDTQLDEALTYINSAHCKQTLAAYQQKLQAEGDGAVRIVDLVLSDAGRMC